MNFSENSSLFREGWVGVKPAYFSHEKNPSFLMTPYKKKRQTLYHEVCDDAVEGAVVIVTPSRQLGEIAACVRGVTPVQLERHFPHPARVTKIYTKKSTFIL